MTSLTNERILVLGASSGIGRETAVLFAQAGAKVYASARRTERLEELAAQYPNIVCGAADATKRESMEACVADAVAKLGGVDILVYSTGTNTPERALTRLTREIWDELIEVNLNSAYTVTAALLPAMREAGKGLLIYVSSISGKYGDVSGAAYQASKRGMLGLAAAVRAEERQHGIRTTVVCPGLINSEFMQHRPVKPDEATLNKALEPVDIAELIFGIAQLHPRACVPDVEIWPTVL
ncbi:MAG: SDR family NAD(P)-dependent oxidoreductase [Bryobacter sp.]